MGLHRIQVSGISYKSQEILMYLPQNLGLVCGFTEDGKHPSHSKLLARNHGRCLLGYSHRFVGIAAPRYDFH